MAQHKMADIEIIRKGPIDKLSRVPVRTSSATEKTMMGILKKHFRQANIIPQGLGDMARQLSLVLSGKNKSFELPFENPGDATRFSRGIRSSMRAYRDRITVARQGSSIFFKYNEKPKRVRFRPG